MPDTAWPEVVTEAVSKRLASRALDIANPIKGMRVELRVEVLRIADV